MLSLFNTHLNAERKIGLKKIRTHIHTGTRAHTHTHTHASSSLVSVYAILLFGSLTRASRGDVAFSQHLALADVFSI